mgnify:CR=1 FL=1
MKALIPLRDSVRPTKKPYINYLLIILNIMIFYKQLKLPSDQLEQLIYRFGLIPSNISLLKWNSLLIGNWDTLFPLITSMFLHGSLLHIGGNMLYLWVFGDNVEDQLGHFKYLLFYLSVGIIGSLVHIFFNPNSTVPMIGASGAIAGVLGAYFLAFPKARVVALVPLFFFITVTQVRAVFFLFLWFILQLINGITSLGVEEAQMVAWWAHIGGFASGTLGYLLLKNRRY